MSLVAVLILQNTPSGIARASVANGWTEGEMPQMALGERVEDGRSSSCTITDFTYYTYTKSDGSFDRVGREAQKQVCAIRNGLGTFGSSNVTEVPYSYEYVKPHTSNAFRVVRPSGQASGLVPVPNQGSFIYRNTSGVVEGVSLHFYDTFIGAGDFEPVYSNVNELAFRLKEPLAAPLRDSAGNVVRLMGSYAFSENGEWMVIEAGGIGLVRVNTKTRAMNLISTDRLRYGQGYAVAFEFAISNDGNSAISSSVEGSVKVYDLTDCQQAPFVAGVDNQVDPGCRSREVRHNIIGQVGSLRSLYQIRYDAEGKSMSGKIVKTEGGVNVTRRFIYSIAGYERPSRLTYLALGDSFSSGEGEFDESYRVAATYSSNPTNKCHVSTRSYPYLVASELGLEDGFHNAACSGAKFDPHYNWDPQYEGSPDDGWAPGTKIQSDFVKQAGSDVITISMIGNDIGFGNKIKRCLMPDTCFELAGDRKSIIKEINGKFGDLIALYTNLKNSSEGTKVYVLGYPKIFSAESSGCRLNVGLDHAERATANKLTSYLNAVIKAAAKVSGVVYIDVENAFTGKQLCDIGSEKAVNGASDDTTASFHPNGEGHRLMAQQLMLQSNNLELPMPPPNSSVQLPDESSEVYSAFLSGASAGGIFARATYTDAVNDTVLRGGTYVVDNINILARPTSVLQAWLHSDPMHVGTVTADESGVLSGTIVIPEDVAPGYHTIHIYGQDLAGEEVDIYKTVFVAVSENDYDGDGTPNNEDACLMSTPSGLDEDRDGVDDVCDPDIGDAPVDSVAPEVVGTPDREPNTTGWYSDDVAITWTAIDPFPSSGAATQPIPTLASREGINMYTSDESCDPLGNCATGSLELKIDKMPPLLGMPVWSCIASCSISAAKIHVPVSDASSGIVAAEYFMGSNDPSQGNATQIPIKDGVATLTFNSGLASGTYNITIRAKDGAGNWSAPIRETAKVSTVLGMKLVSRMPAPSQSPLVTIIQKAAAVAVAIVETVFSKLARLFG